MHGMVILLAILGSGMLAQIQRNKIVSQNSKKAGIMIDPLLIRQNQENYSGD